ncbi:hypothetical protein ACFX2C_040802 [Malus domestica]
MFRISWISFCCAVASDSHSSFSPVELQILWDRRVTLQFWRRITTDLMSTCSAYPTAMMTPPPKISSAHVSKEARLLLLLPPDVVLEEMMMLLGTA